MKFKYKSAEEFNPADLGQSLCMGYEAVLSAFAEDLEKRVNGALGGYLYDMPQFPGDKVNSGIYYAQYVELPTSLIPQKQGTLLKQFIEEVKDIIGNESSFFDLGPGPEWSVRKNTLPALNILNPSAYFPVDLEPEFTEDACKVVAREFPNMHVRGLAKNFHKEALPQSETPTSIIWYPGSTLGNLPSLPGQSFLENQFVVNHLAFLSQLERNIQQNEKSHTAYLVLLMDSKKIDIQSMLDLYNPHETAVNGFKSVLYKLKRDLQAHNFIPEAFTYQARWNEIGSVVEHEFTATKNQTANIKNAFTGAEATLKISEDEKYVLSNSIKPSIEEMKEMIVKSGWEHIRSGEDPEKQFHIHLAKCNINRSPSSVEAI